jgi:hypothetical protein
MKKLSDLLFAQIGYFAGLKLANGQGVRYTSELK